MKIIEEQERLKISSVNIIGAIETLDVAIHEMWQSLITYHYDGGFLLREDSLKCAAYSNLRASLDDAGLTDQGFRVFPEYYLGTQKADLAVIKLHKDWHLSNEFLKQCVQEVCAILELKYRAPSKLKPFEPDMIKLTGYLNREECSKANVYGCFIDEERTNDEPNWLKDIRRFEADHVQILAAWRSEQNRGLQGHYVSAVGQR